MTTEVFHGSTVIVDKPQILPPSRALDYGTGFYTTTSYDQALRWVKRKLSPTNNLGYINHYQIDFDVICNELDILIFRQPTEEWLDFVMSNRKDTNFNHSYDAVYGPVANDKVYTAFALYESGVFNKQELISELKAYELVDQLLFHTTKSLRYLSFVKAQEIRL